MAYAWTTNTGLCFKCSAIIYKCKSINIYGEIQTKEVVKGGSCSSVSYYYKKPGNCFDFHLVIFRFITLKLKVKLG